MLQTALNPNSNESKSALLFKINNAVKINSRHLELKKKKNIIKIKQFQKIKICTLYYYAIFPKE